MGLRKGCDGAAFMAIDPHPVAGHHQKEPGTILLALAFERYSDYESDPRICLAISTSVNPLPPANQAKPEDLAYLLKE
ncbi:hypothetical protein WISP_60039 [Willisornis vidua]|uniref:Uncharacterized protein n=1 Tax=Willisornis vidua TaxID=1566151 RepID=A0ABQ9DG05_9PASS|nr:hypothetical protein WISP_60039 [Willisornis vidua]